MNLEEGFCSKDYFELYNLDAFCWSEGMIE